jgi:hypothetical protein
MEKEERRVEQVGYRVRGEGVNVWMCGCVNVFMLVGQLVG